MKNFLKLISLCAIVVFMTSCEDDNGIGESSNVVTFESGSPLEFIEVEGTKTASVKMYTGNTSGSDRTVGIMVDMDNTTLDAAAYSVPASVTIPGGSNEATLEYQITDDNISLAGGDLVIAIGDAGNLQAPAGTNNYSSITISVQYENCPPANSVNLTLVLDAYAEETSWQILDADNGDAVVASGGQDEAYDDLDGTTIDEDFCIESGNYTFVINDAFGDGICCNYGNGSYTVTVNGAVVANGGSFGASESTSFTVQ